MRLAVPLGVVLVLIGAHSLSAHPSPHSLIELDLHEKSVTASLSVPLQELELAFGKPLLDSPRERLAENAEDLARYLLAHVDIRNPDGVPWQKRLAGALSLSKESDNRTEDPIDLVARVEWLPPTPDPVRRLILRSDLVVHQVPSHKILVTVRSDWDGGIFAAQPKTLTVLRFLNSEIAVDRSDGGLWRGFASVFVLGVQHILEGTDHLLFLLMLLLPAPLLRQGWTWGQYGGLKRTAVDTAKVVTAFTLGHSLTLLLGACGWNPVPEKLVESLIAVSILVSAVHVLKPIFLDKEWMVAGFFGLIHGLAFSRTIADLGLDHLRLALSVAGFNLGIEFIQLAVLAVVTPVTILLARTGRYSYLRIPAGIAGALISLYWLGERTLKP